MKNTAFRSVAVAAVAFSLFALLDAQAAETGRVGRKLGRGFANTLFGIAEIPQTIVAVSREHGGGAGATWGVVKGIGRFVAREGTGVYEIITFPLPFPRNYDPIMQPEFPLSSDKGEI